MTSRPRTVRERIGRIAFAQHPELSYMMPRTMLVRAVDSNGACDVYPPPDAPDLQPIDKVEQWTMGGSLYFPAAGTSCIVIFRDADPTRPAIVAFAPAAAGPANARVSDHAGRLALDSVGLLYYSDSEAGTYLPIPPGPLPGPPLPAFAGLPVKISTGSGSVKTS